MNLNWHRWKYPFFWFADEESITPILFLLWINEKHVDEEVLSPSQMNQNIGYMWHVSVSYQRSRIIRLFYIPYLQTTSITVCVHNLFIPLILICFYLPTIQNAVGVVLTTTVFIQKDWRRERMEDVFYITIVKTDCYRY